MARGKKEPLRMTASGKQGSDSDDALRFVHLLSHGLLRDSLSKDWNAKRLSFPLLQKTL